MTISHSDTSELVQLMEGTTTGALIPEIVRQGFQNLLAAEVSAALGVAKPRDVGGLSTQGAGSKVSIDPVSGCGPVLHQQSSSNLHITSYTRAQLQAET